MNARISKLTSTLKRLGTVELGPLTLFSGLNGTGKSGIVSSYSIVVSGRSIIEDEGADKKEIIALAPDDEKVREVFIEAEVVDASGAVLGRPSWRLRQGRDTIHGPEHGLGGLKVPDGVAVPGVIMSGRVLEILGRREDFSRADLFRIIAPAGLDDEAIEAEMPAALVELWREVRSHVKGDSAADRIVAAIAACDRLRRAESKPSKSAPTTGRPPAPSDAELLALREELSKTIQHNAAVQRRQQAQARREAVLRELEAAAAEADAVAPSPAMEWRPPAVSAPAAPLSAVPPLLLPLQPSSAANGSREPLPSQPPSLPSRHDLLSVATERIAALNDVREAVAGGVGPCPCCGALREAWSPAAVRAAQAAERDLLDQLRLRQGGVP